MTLVLHKVICISRLLYQPSPPSSSSTITDLNLSCSVNISHWILCNAWRTNEARLNMCQYLDLIINRLIKFGTWAPSFFLVRSVSCFYVFAFCISLRYRFEFVCEHLGVCVWQCDVLFSSFWLFIWILTVSAEMCLQYSKGAVIVSGHAYTLRRQFSSIQLQLNAQHHPIIRLFLSLLPIFQQSYLAACSLVSFPIFHVHPINQNRMWYSVQRCLLIA